MLTHFELDTILKSYGYSIQKEGKKEKKISVGILKGPYAPNFDSVGINGGYVVNIEQVNPSKNSKGGFAAGDSSLKMGRMDKFYQLCVDKAGKRGLLIFIQYDRNDYYEKAITSRQKRLEKQKHFKKNLPGGEKIFALIDTDIIILRYQDDYGKANKMVEEILLKHDFPLK